MNTKVTQEKGMKTVTIDDGKKKKNHKGLTLERDDIAI